MIVKAVLTIVCLFSIGGSANRCTGLQPDYTHQEKLDSFIQQVMTKYQIPGLTIAIVQDGDMVYAQAFGVRNLDTREPMKPEYLFHMASVSKPFVATAVMQLVEQDKIGLDEPLITYLPYFRIDDDRYEQITIRQMLNHTSGMPDVLDYEWDNPQTDKGASERYVRSLTGEKMIAAPGERWRYSNMAYDVMGDLIAKMSGQPFEVYVKENILNPLGMHHSTFFYPETDESLRTTPHIWETKPIVSKVYPYNRPHAPSSTLNSSVVEMTNWALVNLNRGELRGERILKEESYDLLYTPSADIQENVQIGLSWFIRTYRDETIISHSGGDRGYRSYFGILPEKNLGFVLASNYDRTPVESIVEGVLDILLGHEPQAPKPSIVDEFVSVYLEKGLEAAKAHYRKLEKEAADEYTFGDRELNGLGYYFLRDNEVVKAIEIFTFNVELFPEVGNTYDSLGEAYMISGDREQAIANYRKALELDPSNENAKAMLTRLGAQVK